MEIVGQRELREDSVSSDANNQKLVGTSYRELSFPY